MTLAPMAKEQPLVLKCEIGAIHTSAFLFRGTDVSRTRKLAPVIFGSAFLFGGTDVSTT